MRTLGYMVSDCTGKALKAVTYIQDHIRGATPLVSKRRLYDAVDISLSRQNPDCGFASFEPAPARLGG
ncbi:uncharacterized protein TRAVEDRAFT_47144 [Trametes versicolor FP-101664 SS1]|uniref:uncharacterized protein n=1 Tax=Trametes versicolor (strain FP-101664) TaxID=717944 RepID=UPI000462398A|nr:uncharacterized protein TRAVEDRAFT_47144 [Trametes versicolor FP-101664 SS1]EIW59842.1 hypothetical protein TRAVEDRAFT_47144 [Trametes versicolor FP-101664 SS1]